MICIKKNLMKDMEKQVKIYFNNKKSLEIVMGENQYNAFKADMLAPVRFIMISDQLFINKDEIYLIEINRE